MKKTVDKNTLYKVVKNKTTTSVYYGNTQICIMTTGLSSSNILHASNIVKALNKSGSN